MATIIGTSNNDIITPAAQVMEQVYPLVIDIQQLGSYIQLIEGFGLRQVTHVSLDREHCAPALAVSIIDTNPPEQRIGRVPKHLQIKRVRHVAVIVDPLRPYLRPCEP